jgi:site-specific recombinase XerC
MHSRRHVPKRSPSPIVSPHEEGRFAARAAVRNRAILWLFYDTGIRVSEKIICSLRKQEITKRVLKVSSLGDDHDERAGYVLRDMGVGHFLRPIEMEHISLDLFSRN